MLKHTCCSSGVDLRGWDIGIFLKRLCTHKHWNNNIIVWDFSDLQILSSLFLASKERSRVRVGYRAATQELERAWYVGQGCFINPSWLSLQTTTTSLPMRRCRFITSLPAGNAPSLWLVLLTAVTTSCVGGFCPLNRKSLLLLFHVSPSMGARYCHVVIGD